ncbi:MAG TPA: VOC family protein [Pyrinomonadaceae bacterium]|jgi:predicted enzyme related to lactoylglutathione lyase
MLKQLDYAMVMVSDMRRSVEFYRDTLGIALKFQSPEWTEFLTGTTTLALHGGGVPQKHSGPPSEGKPAGVCTIGFNVEDLDKTYEELKAKGVNFVMPPTQQEAEGIKLAVAIDPDGLTISFAQPLAR